MEGFKIMKALFSSKKAIIAAIVGGIAIIGGIIAIVLMNGNKGDSYRTIQVYEVDGTAEVDRLNVGILTPYANMALESEDDVSTFNESYMQLRLDDDKYILAEPNTNFVVVATGTKADSNTTIHLNSGAITNSIENKLSDSSSYEVITPNATMAVRGTRFRVYVYFDENGVSHTKLEVYEGEVEIHLIYPDGSTDENGVHVLGGESVGVWGNSTDSGYDFLDGSVKYEELRTKVLEFLKICIEKGNAKLTITAEEIQEIIDGRLNQPEEAGNDESESTGNESTEATGESVGNEEAGTDTETASEADNAETAQNTETVTYTVTFNYNGSEFGTQEVVGGETAQEPTLMPAETGNWDFDFSSTITEDTTVNWKE